jgi:hypothetical protein
MGIAMKAMLKTPDYQTKIANRAFYLSTKELSDELSKIVNDLAFIDEGPEFEYPKEELEFLAHKLILNEDNALEQMRNARPIQPIVFSRPWLGKELQKQLALLPSYDPAKVASWAENMLICYKNDLSQEFIDILEVLSWMWQRPEFVFSKKHLDFLADKLILNEDTALEQMGKLD